jgi:glucosamine--fructose-6-phosphate aminotransferase (isomerizing)
MINNPPSPLYPSYAKASDGKQGGAKRKFEYKMLKEIHEQPKLLEKIIKKRLDKKTGKIVFSELANHHQEIKKIKHFVLLGCGTSFHAAMLGNYLFEELTGLPCESELAEEFDDRKVVIEKNTAFIIISQSGATGDALTATYKAKGKGALVIALTNNTNSLLAKTADLAIDLMAGEEKAVVATKTFTAEYLNLLLLALFVREMHKPATIKVKKLKAEILVITKKIQRIIKSENSILKLASKFKNIRQLIVLGEKYNFPVALEAALKIKESVYLKTEGLELREFKHGPMAIVNKNLPVLFIIPTDSVYKENLPILKEVKNYSDKIIIITNYGNKLIEKISPNILKIPSSLELLNPLLYIIPAQLFAYYLAVLNNKNPDKPRHLKKFVEK